MENDVCKMMKFRIYSFVLHGRTSNGAPCGIEREIESEQRVKLCNKIALHCIFDVFRIWLPHIIYTRCVFSPPHSCVIHLSLALVSSALGFMGEWNATAIKRYAKISCTLHSVSFDFSSVSLCVFSSLFLNLHSLSVWEPTQSLKLAAVVGKTAHFEEA